MSDISPLVESLSNSKAAGLSPVAAAALVAQACAGGSGAPPFEISPESLAQALEQVFPGSLTPAELAQIIHTQFPDLPALGVAEAVLAGLPGTSRADMLAALVGAGLPANDSQGAVNILYPVTIAIQANQAWQAAGVTLTGQQVTHLAFVSGSWSANPADGTTGPDGYPQFPSARPGYTLPTAPQGAMIGRIGNNAPFLVGSAYVVQPGPTGDLSLCINDDLDGRYGMGLRDNFGALTFTITTTGS
ncbi:hypothetical protein UCD39_24955 [Nitrospirillum sp. BR 11752]|uniref:hypothetical protein n=1 Tax=Nitrospirillum sp. BR 11752 TaxID=3104293 RepID=UPI002EA3E49F|nr:hypothetical protein [Nitrospirillum sp. BR 11752]